MAILRKISLPMLVQKGGSTRLYPAYPRSAEVGCPCFSACRSRSGLTLIDTGIRNMFLPQFLPQFFKQVVGHARLTAISFRIVCLKDEINHAEF